MLDAVHILFALGLPWLTGALFVMAVWQTRQPGYRPLVAGMGLPLGLVGVIGGYLVLGHWGPGLHFGANVAIQVGLAVVFAALAWRRWRRPEGEPASYPAVDTWRELSNGWRWLIGLVLAWLVLRWLGIVIEVVHRPLFPWDAWYAYGLQAKVWFFQSNFEQFVTGMKWFQVEGPAWTAGRVWNPPGIGLMQLWILQALESYDEALMNLAWPVVLPCLGLTFFGLFRLTGASLPIAVGMAACILMLPLLNTHATLAGYADLWIGVYMMLAVVGGLFVQWWGVRWLLVTAVALAGMVMMKESSWIWVLILVAGLLAFRVRLRWLILLGLLVVMVFMGSLWIHGESIQVTTFGRFGFTDGTFVFPQKINLDAWRDIVMWPALLRHLFVYDNWHLFWYLVPFVAVGSIWYARFDRGIAMAALIVWISLAVLIGFFSFSTLGNAVVDGTSVNRLMLHLLPSIGLLAGLVVTRVQSEWIEQQQVGEGDDA